MKNKKVKIYKKILNLLIMVAFIIANIIIYQYMSNKKNEEEMREISERLISQTNSNNANIEEEANSTNIEFEQSQNSVITRKEKKVNNTIKGYKIIGVITIPKINLKYPILEINNEETMKISITKFCGENVNDIGNLTLAGHNNLDGTMFGKIKRLKLGDEIEITNLNSKSEIYKIYNIYIVNPDDLSVVNKAENKKEVTLITCSNGRKNRLIVKAKVL